MARIVVVTGGAGFIGSALTRALAERGDEVRVLDNFATGKRQNLEGIKGRLRVIEGDILDGELADQVFAGADVVFHLAAIPSVPRSVAAPMVSHHANATGTLAVLEAARRSGVRRLIYAGSSSAYGHVASLPMTETMPVMPLSPYAAAKLAGEHYCRIFARIYGVETVVLRYFNVFGPGQDPASQYAAVIPRFITAALAGQSPVVYGDGEQSRDFCFIDNAVEANLLAAEASGVSGMTFNIACGTTTSLNQVLALLGQLLGRRVEARYEAARVGDIRISLADITEARARLGYAACVPFADGLARTLRWYQTGQIQP